MPVTVELPGVLREHAAGRTAIEVEVQVGTTVGALLDQVDREHPALGRRLRDEQGRLRRFVNVYVGDVDIRTGDGLATPLRDGDRMLILPSVAGGADPSGSGRVASPPELKPRSRDVTDGLEKAAARGMLRAVGMSDEDFAKPQIGVASSWNEITPCNLSLDRLAKAAKDGVHAAGGFPLEFGTISVSDGISMGHEGMHFSLVSREVIADSVETVMQAERLDGSVLLAGCDKSLPGMLMAAARLDLAAVFLYAGSILPGRARLSDGTDREVTIIDAFEAVGACARGLMSREDVDAIERAICPGEGACGGMYTANTMASAAEALGMSLPGSAAPPATDRRRDGFARRSGEAVVGMLREGITARQVLTRPAFENAIAVVMALGGSTNAVLHLLAIAREAEVDLTLDDFNLIGDKVPHLADVKP
ncbi:MAG: dihydroxy-acid dehydratase, partial [Actinomycetes bacterium]